MEKFECVVMLEACPKRAHVNRYNGYIAFDSKCPWYLRFGIDCQDYEGIQCNGGITYAKYHKRDDLKDFEIVDGNPEDLEDKIIVIGFDTLHGWDSDKMWPKEKVAIEAYKMKEQLYKLKPDWYEDPDDWPDDDDDPDDWPDDDEADN